MVDLSQLEKVKTPGDLQAESESAEALAYLSSTDWYVIRLAEIGEEIPDEVKQKRAAARLAVIPGR